MDDALPAPSRRLELARLILETNREPDPVASAVLDLLPSERAYLPLPYPSSNPLVTCLDPLTRAVVVLLCRAREDPLTVSRALPALRQHPTTVLRRAASLIAPAPLPQAYPNHLAIHLALPNPAARLPLALRASGLFDPETIADLLGIHRATLYRRLDSAIHTLSRLRVSSR